MVYGLGGLAYLVGGVGLAIDQVLRRASRCELRLDAGAIRAILALGPISWSKTVPRSAASQLAVVRRGHMLDASPIAGKPGDYHVLVAEDETGQRRVLVANYPRDMLLALAVELSSRWKSPDIDPDVDGVGAGKLAVVEDTEVLTDIRERRDRPLGLGLICERLGGRGVRITRPPHGLASSRGCLISMFGIAITPLIFAAVLSIPLTLYRNGFDLLFARLLTFVCIGAGVLWCAYLRRRRGDVDSPLRPDRDPGPPHARDARCAARRRAGPGRSKTSRGSAPTRSNLRGFEFEPAFRTRV